MSSDLQISLTISGVESDLLKQWIEKKVKKIAAIISIPEQHLSAFWKQLKCLIDTALEECSKIAGASSQPDTSLGTTDSIKPIHTNPNALLNELELHSCEKKDDSIVWKNFKGEKVVSSTLCTLVDQKLTQKYLSMLVGDKKKQPESPLTNGTEVLEILLAVASTYIEKQREINYVISENGEQNVTLINWTGAVRVIVSFMSGIVVLKAALAYNKLPAKVETDLVFSKLKLRITGVESICLRNWIEDTLKALGIDLGFVRKGIDHVMSKLYFRINFDGVTANKQRSNEIRKQELDAMLLKEPLDSAPKKISDHLAKLRDKMQRGDVGPPPTDLQAAPSKMDEWLKGRSGDRGMYSNLLTYTYHKKQDELLGIPELKLAEYTPSEGSGNDKEMTVKRWRIHKREATREKFVAIVDTKITKYIWIKRDDAAIRLQLKKVFNILQTVSTLRLENQWLIENNLCSGEKKLSDHLIVLVAFMTAAAVVQACIILATGH